MFRCPKCRNYTNLPQCSFCGYQFTNENGIYILSDDPNMIIDNKEDKYIGYEHIGEYYNGRYWYKISNKNLTIGKAISEIVGGGILLDLACGDGDITVPVAKYGCQVIAADISSRMLTLLIKKAEYNSIDIQNVTVCRMNALDIPIANNSVDFVTANGVLHLISNPEKVLREIKRVLKPGGKFISLDDAPGKQSETDNNLNQKYMEILNNFYRRYWELLKGKNINPKKYNWKFDKSKISEEMFGNKSTIEINFDEEYCITLNDNFLYRMSGKGFSDQSNVPDDTHKEAYNQVISEFISRYGEDFAKISYIGKESNIKLELFEKIDM